MRIHIHQMQPMATEVKEFFAVVWLQGCVSSTFHLNASSSSMTDLILHAKLASSLDSAQQALS